MTITNTPPASHAAQRAEAHEGELLHVITHPAHVKLAADLEAAVSARDAAVAQSAERLALYQRELDSSAALANENHSLRIKLEAAQRRLSDEMQQAAQCMERDRIALNQSLTELDAERASRKEADKARAEDEELLLDSLCAALEKVDAPECEKCEGTGDMAVFSDQVAVGYSRTTPLERVDIEECEDCRGIGREWL